jgi:hypothetical protein
MVCEDAYTLTGCGNCEIQLLDNEVMKKMNIESIFQVIASFVSLDIDNAIILMDPATIDCNGNGLVVTSIRQPTGTNPAQSSGAIEFNKMSIRFILKHWYDAQAHRDTEEDVVFAKKWAGKLNDGDLTMEDGTVFSSNNTGYVKEFVEYMISQWCMDQF